MRVALRADGPRTHTLEVELDHLAADGASVAILVTDLVTAYEARLVGDAPRWAPLPVQYVDYALWNATRRPVAGTPNSGRMLSRTSIRLCFPR
ncbi:hypothetical protein GS421_03215 [Rhodococcus hoagii]|nr:hypothetical protein [Prescottella equi]